MCNITLFSSSSSFIICSWAQGYDGGASSFVSKDTLCFVCGNNVKFINIKDRKTSFLPAPGDGIGVLTTNSAYNLYAFSELKANPRIFIYMFPDFSRPRAILKGRPRISQEIFSRCYRFVSKYELKIIVISSQMVLSSATQHWLLPTTVLYSPVFLVFQTFS